MLKRNKSISAWFSRKTAEEQAELLTMSARKSAAFHKKHIQLQRNAVATKRDMLEAIQEEQAAEERLRQKVASVMWDLRPHQGPCCASGDVDHLLHHYGTKEGMRTALRAKLLFQKMVLKKKSPLLMVTGPLLSLVNRLKELFGGEPLPELPPLHCHGGCQQRCQQVEEESDPGDVDSEPEDESEPDEPEFETSFRFQQEGDIVAVYYVEDFFIGEVTRVISEEEATVNFLEKAGSKDGVVVYRWPRSEDCTEISSAVVFAKNLQLAPSSSSGHLFFVESPRNLFGGYQAFRAIYRKISCRPCQLTPEITAM